MRLVRLVLRASLPLVLFPVTAQAPAGAQSSPAAVVVFDGSGSMWGNLGTERGSKFDLAREAFRQSFANVSREARVGLVSFGHRRKSDCSDVEVIAAPDVGAAERLPPLIDKLNPRGKGPLVLALREAAKAVPPGAPGSLILVHDGPDNCQQDPCAAAAEIAKANPGLAIHVISVGLEPADAQRMSCVAKATRGKMFEVSDALSLSASVAEAVRLANLDRSTPSTRAKPGGPPPPAPAGEPAAATGPSGLRLSAELASGGPVLTAPVAWRIKRADAEGEVALEKSAAEVSENLPAGSYVVLARYGLVSAQATVEVARKGPTVARFTLQAGTIKLAAKANKNGDALALPLITIASAGEDAAAPRAAEPIWIGRDPDAELIVPAGSYVVRVADGLARRDVSVTVAAGGRADVALVLGTGRLELDAVASQGGESLKDVTFVIAEDDPDAPSGRREVARSAAVPAAFTLTAGTYYVAARLGTAEAKELVAIGTGDIVKRALVLEVGRLSLTAVLDTPPLPQDQPTTFRVLRLEGGAQEIARSTAAAPEFLLPQGRYRVEAQVAANIKSATDVDLVPGKEAKIALKLEAGQVTIKRSSDAAAGSSDGPWEVTDGHGTIVLRSGQGEQRTALLAPGSYVVRSHKGQPQVETTFEIKPGEQRTVELPRL